MAGIINNDCRQHVKILYSQTNVFKAFKKNQILKEIIIDSNSRENLK